MTAVLQTVPPRIAEIVQANFETIGVTLAAYLLVFLVITFLAHNRLNRDITDFTVANRNMGWVVVVFSIYATITSGVGMAGFPGFIYVNGLPFIAGTVLGYGLVTIFIWYFGRRLKILGDEHALNTPGDLLGGYYQSDGIRILSAVVAVLYYIPFLVAQFVAAGIFVHVLSGATIPQQAGTVIIAALVGVHVLVTGLRGIGWLDTVNGLIMTLMFGLFFVYIMFDTGGPANVMTGLRQAGAGAHVALPGPTGWNTNAIYGLAIGFYIGGGIVGPHTIIRFYSTDRVQNMVKIALGILVLFGIQHLLGTYWMGTYGRVLFPSVENPDYVSSLLAFDIMPVFFAALFLVSVLAAIISTCDSYLHTLSTVLARDALRSVFLPGLDDEGELRANHVIIPFAALISVILALNFTGLILPLALFAGGIAIQLFPAIFGAIVWPRASTEAALMSTSLGIILGALWFFGIIPYPLTWIGPTYFGAFLINFVVFIAISFATSPQQVDVVKQFHGVIKDRM